MVSTSAVQNATAWASEDGSTQTVQAASLAQQVSGFMYNYIYIYIYIPLSLWPASSNPFNRTVW